MEYPEWITKRFGEDIPEWAEKRFGTEKSGSPFWTNGDFTSESRKIYKKLSKGDIVTGYVTPAKIGVCSGMVQVCILKGRKPVEGIAAICSQDASGKHDPFDTVAVEIISKGNDDHIMYGRIISKSI